MLSKLKNQTKTPQTLVYEGFAGFLFQSGSHDKYVYPKSTLEEMDELFRRELDKHFPGARVEYLV